MGRKRKNHVYAYFTYQKETNSSKCNVEGCNKVIKGQHGTNLLNHLSSKHSDEYNMVLKYNLLASETEENGNNGEGSSNNHPKLIKRYILQECLNLVTIHGRPFELLDDAAFRNIIKLIPMNVKDHQSFNSHNIKLLLHNKAEAVRYSIQQELKNKLLCLKIDYATRFDRTFFGINVQFLKNAKIAIRHLGVIEMDTRSTADLLRENILCVLRKYRLEIIQIFTITTDNGSNMVKLAKLNQQTDTAEESHEDLDESDSEDEGDWTDFSPLFTPFTTEDGTSYTVSPVRCAVHTLQLAIGDALDEESNSLAVIREARRVVRILNTPTFLNILRTAQKRKPTLDCSTRWHSTFDMLENLWNLKDCCSTDPNNSLYLSEATWVSIEGIINSLLPARILAKQLQREQLAFTDFYCAWMKCIIDTEKVLTPLAAHLSIAMKTRQKSLMNDKAFLMAMFLDGRVNVVLSSAETEEAIKHLLNLWKHIQSVCKTDIDANSHSCVQMDQDVKSECEDDFEALLHHTSIMKQRSVQDDENKDIEAILRDFLKEPRIRSSQNILEYWESNKIARPTLYSLAKIVLAIPATQVSVERLFSSLRFIKERLRYNLNDSIVENILVIRNNGVKNSTFIE